MFDAYLESGFSIDRLPEDKQLLVIPFMMRTLRMAGLGECAFGPLHPEDEEVTEVCLRYTAFREEDLVEYFSLYERIGVLIQNPFWNPKSIAELASENVLGLITRCLFIGEALLILPAM